MNRRIVITATILCLTGLGSAAEEAGTTQAGEASGSLRLWYSQPATEWSKALPIGSGGNRSSIRTHVQMWDDLSHSSLVGVVPS